MAILKLDHVVKRFGEFTAVDDLSFEVAEGGIFGQTLLYTIINKKMGGSGGIIWFVVDFCVQQFESHATMFQDVCRFYYGSAGP